MKEIIRSLKDKGREVRIVATAVTFETLNEIMEVMAEIPYSKVDIIQMNIAKTETIKQFHLIRALNPIFMTCITFAPIQTEQPAKRHPRVRPQEQPVLSLE